MHSHIEYSTWNRVSKQKCVSVRSRKVMGGQTSFSFHPQQISIYSASFEQIQLPCETFNPHGFGFRQCTTPERVQFRCSNRQNLKAVSFFLENLLTWMQLNEDDDSSSFNFEGILQIIDMNSIDCFSSESNINDNHSTVYSITVLFVGYIHCGVCLLQ